MKIYLAFQQEEEFSWKPLSDFQFRKYAKECLVDENFSLLDASLIFLKENKTR